MASGKQLMEEIYDQFLVCKICFEIYKRPKTLVCLHTFCADCLEKHSDAQYERSYRYMLYNRSVSCPICRKKTDLPTGGVRRLPDNFLIANLADVVSRRKPTGKQQECEICKPDLPLKQRLAVSKCLDCAKLLCKYCVDLHKKTKVTQEHSLFDTEVEKDIECKVHPDEVVRFYCEPCEVCVCVVCTFQEHKGHEISSFSEGLQKYQNSFDKIVSMCREHISNVKDQLQLITKCETEIKVAEDQIRDMAIDTITTIRKKERNMVEDLHGFYGEETLEFLKEKQPLQEKLEDLQSTCNLTDIISRDKSIELLLLKREIQEKVSHLLQTNIDAPPPNIAQELKFVPGQVDFGYLHVGGQVKSCGNEDGSVDVRINKAIRVADTSSVDSQTDRVAISNQETLTEESLRRGSNMLVNAQHKVTQTKLLLTKDNSTSPILPPAPKIRSRFTMTAPVNLENRQTMTVAIPTIKAKTQTLSIDTIDQCTNTLLEVHPSESKYTNTPSSPKCERSTLTITKTCQDELTDTLGLVVYCEKQTATPEAIMRCENTMTDFAVCVNQATLTNNPVYADKVTLTPKIKTLEKHCMTNTVTKHDTGVEAKLMGIDKGVSTKAIVTVNSGEGDSNVCTKDVMINTPWSVERVEQATVSTMYEVDTCDKETSTKPQLVRNQGTFTKWFNMSHNSSNTPQVEFIHASCGPDITINEPEAKKTKLETSSMQTELNHLDLTKLWNYFNIPKIDSSTNTEITTTESKSTNVNSERPNMVDVSVSFGVPLYELTDSSTSTNIIQEETGTTMGSMVESVSQSVCTESIDHNHVAVHTDLVDTFDQASGPEYVTHTEQGTSMGHLVHTIQRGMCTESKQLRDEGTEMAGIQTRDATMNTKVETRDVAILKRPHSISRGVNTKKFKTGDKTTETNRIETLNKMSNTIVETCDTSCDPINFLCHSKNEGTVSIILKDSSTCMVPTNETSRGTSPHRYNNFTDRACSPVTYETQNVGTDVKPETCDMGTGDRTIVHKESGTSTVQINLCHKAMSPIRDLVKTKNSSVGTEVCKLDDRASSPIRQCIVNRGINTVNLELIHRAASPVRFYGKDFGVSVHPEVHDQETETIPKSTVDSSTGTKHVRIQNTSTSMPTVKYSEKQTSTKRIQNMNKMVATDNICSEDKQTMTFDVTANYRELVTPSTPLTVTRGTNTAYKSTDTKETSPVRDIYTEKASSPVRFPTFDKAVTANKAELLEPKEQFQAPGLSTKPLKPISDSVKSNLESIEELRESDEEHATKEIQTETPPRSPRASFGRKAISALDLRQFPISPSFTHKEKFVLSNPRLGRYRIDESTFSMVSRGTRTIGNNSIVCKVETSTNTNGVGVESKGTSTPPVEMEDKAVCTEAIHVTKNDKMAACISKLQTVQQRLEQQPVYVQASTDSKHRMSKSVEEGKCEKSDTQSEKALSVSLHCTAVKKRDIEKSNTGLQPTADPPNRCKSVEKDSETESYPSFVSPILRRRIITKQESSEDSEDYHSKGKVSLARKKKPDLAQLLERSSSLPEQDSPPYSIPKPKLQAIVPHVIPKLNVDSSTLQPSKDKNRGSPKMKPRQRKLSPMKRAVTSPLMHIKSEPKPLLPSTPDKQKARQERIARLKKDREKLQSPGPGKAVSNVAENDPKAKVIKGGRPVNAQNLVKVEDSSSSSS